MLIQNPNPVWTSLDALRLSSLLLCCGWLGMSKHVVQVGGGEEGVHWKRMRPESLASRTSTRLSLPTANNVASLDSARKVAGVSWRAVSVG